MPITAANTASSTRIPVTSAVLSLEPNVEIAKSFTGGGREVDAGTAHGDHGRTLGTGEARHELAHAQRDGGGDQAREQACDDARPGSGPAWRGKLRIGGHCHIFYSL